MVKKISEKEFEQVKKSKLAVVDFSATWCGPCKMLAPVLEDVAEELKDKVEFYNVDVDENPGLAQQFNIMTIPTLVILKDGEKVTQQVGFQPKEGIVQFIEEQM